MTDKMREEFESAWAEVMRGDDQAPGRKPLRSQIDPERYRGDAVNFAWNWWQRSRAAVVIDLPTVGPAPEAPEDAIDDSYLDAHHAAIRMRNRCYLAIESAGLKVKS